uniref:Uncharacterized protein n=1 Tax=Rhizophora mucronata TaxID=61149 RepID=A0A2P2MR88_RHIMU
MTHNGPYGRYSIQRVNERTSTTSALRQMHMDKVLVSLFPPSPLFSPLLSILSYPFDDSSIEVDHM